MRKQLQGFPQPPQVSPNLDLGSPVERRPACGHSRRVSKANSRQLSGAFTGLQKQDRGFAQPSQVSQLLNLGSSVEHRQACSSTGFPQSSRVSQSLDLNSWVGHRQACGNCRWFFPSLPGSAKVLMRIIFRLRKRPQVLRSPPESAKTLIEAARCSTDMRLAEASAGFSAVSPG